MKELREVENFGVTSHAFKSGDLKMVKVRRGKRGHRQSRSLVFRISRTSKPNSDDSSIKCSSTDEETSTLGERIQTSWRELKIRIPKRVLHDSAEKKETVEYVPPEHQVFRDGNKLKVTTHKDVSSSRMNNLCAREDAPNLNEADLRSNRSILCPNSRILNDSSKETMTRMAEMKLKEPRRSSRRIVLRVQKECQPNYPVKESPKAPHAFSFCPSRRNEPQVCLGMKRKRGRKPGVRATECKKQKYGRRGRPPKSPPKLPKQLSLVKPEGGDSTEKLVLMAPPKNSVWTLVPKELFESDFFKSQLVKVRSQNSSERGPRRNFVRSACGPKQAKFPKVLNTAVRERAPDEKDPKRPTVIYFKKKFDQKREVRNPPKLLLPNRVSKTENDMMYLFNKYRMFQDIILKNYYELAGGNLNETERMLSNFLSNNSDVSRVKKGSSSCEPQVNSPHYSVFDLNSAGQASRPVSNPFLPSSEVPSGDPCRGTVFGTTLRDTLTREIIVQSLQMLYSDEAVLG